MDVRIRTNRTKDYDISSTNVYERLNFGFSIRFFYGNTMNEARLRELMIRAKLSIIGEMTVEERARQFGFALKLILPPKDLSDQACLRNLCKWLIKKCKLNQFHENEVFRLVLDFAIEASGPTSKNPLAVFMYILKKELGYLSD